MAIGLSGFALASCVAACAVVYHAAATREQFYPAMLYLASSKLSLLVLSNLALLLLFLCARCVKTLFLGRLREAEVERLYELGRHELMETCLALTIFRDQFDSTLLFMFLALISVKLFHCLAHKRLEYVETTPALRFLAHARLLLFLFLLLTVDAACLNYAASRTLYHLRNGQRPTSLLLFSFE
jgi:E3 ubiquitin-protein ligase synoviolin